MVVASFSLYLLHGLLALFPMITHHGVGSTCWIQHSTLFNMLNPTFKFNFVQHVESNKFLLTRVCAWLLFVRFILIPSFSLLFVLFLGEISYHMSTYFFCFIVVHMIYILIMFTWNGKSISPKLNFFVLSVWRRNSRCFRPQFGWYSLAKMCSVSEMESRFLNT